MGVVSPFRSRTVVVESAITPLRNVPAEEKFAWFRTAWIEIRQGNTAWEAALAEGLSGGLRYLVARSVNQDVEDIVQDTLMIVLKALREGKIDDPAGVLNYARTIARRQISERFNRREREYLSNTDVDSAAGFVPDERQDMERDLYHREQVRVLKEVLAELDPRDRDILNRFYVLEEPKEKICAEMGLTDTQYRLLKNRAKDRFVLRGKAVLAKVIKPKKAA